MFLIFLLFIISLAITIIEFKRRNLSRKYRHVPGIKEYPIIGNIYTIMPNEIKDFDILTQKFQVAPVSKVLILCKLWFCISDPQVLKEILTSKLCTARPYPMRFFVSKYGIIPADR